MCGMSTHGKSGTETKSNDYEYIRYCRKCGRRTGDCTCYLIKEILEERRQYWYKVPKNIKTIQQVSKKVLPIIKTIKGSRRNE